MATVAGDTPPDLQSRVQDQCSLSDAEIFPRLLLDVAKRLANLALSVWKKMKEQVHISPIILDPNTANCWLQRSDDLTSGRRAETPQHLPDIPERNTANSSVLGWNGFSAGQHSWEVEVRGQPHWVLGAAKKSADWKAD